MSLNGKKYIVKVPAGKGTNDFRFDELLPAFRKFCAKQSQNGGTRIASYRNTLEVPRELSWAELLNDVIEQFRPSLEQIEHISAIPTDAEGHFLLSRETYEDYRTINEVMSHVGPAVWERWDEMSKIYWKSCIPRLRMLLEQGVIAEE